LHSGSVPRFPLFPGKGHGEARPDDFFIDVAASAVNISVPGPVGSFAGLFAAFLAAGTADDTYYRQVVLG
jgi:hypothetical protein